MKDGDRSNWMDQDIRFSQLRHKDQSYQAGRPSQLHSNNRDITVTNQTRSVLPFFRSWFGSNQNPPDSQNSELLDKVPKQMRSSLQRKKSKQSPTSINNVFEDFKNLFTFKLNDCSICLEAIRKPCQISNCGHQFCSECIINYMTFKINAIEQIICPSENCDKKIDFDSNAWKSLPETYKEKYKKQQLWRQTIQNPDLKLCPNQKCKNGTINLRKIPPTCQKCRTQFCQECMMKAHSGQECDENFSLNFKEWKRCPRCKIFIQKTQGCNHMVCRCKHEFCFPCLEPWNNKHYSCLDDKNNEIVDPNRSICPKFSSILMVLALPIYVAIGLVLLGLSAVFSLGIGICLCFYAIVYCMKDFLHICAGVILIPIVVPIVAIFICGLTTYTYFLPILLQYLSLYTRNIRNLWNRN